jgi:hypothetical protein
MKKGINNNISLLSNKKQTLHYSYQNLKHLKNIKTNAQKSGVTFTHWQKQVANINKNCGITLLPNPQ